MRDEAAVWQVSMEVNRYDKVNGIWRGYERMGGHTTIARGADTVNTLKINNMEYGAGWGGTRAIAQLGTASDGYTATFNDPTPAAIALGLNAEYSRYDVTAGAQVDLESAAPEEGKAWFLAHQDVSEFGLVRKNGLLVADGGNAAIWTATTTRAVGDYIVPTTNTSPIPAVTDHVYKVTVATGATPQSGASEPTYPTDGTTVVDGDLVLQDMGIVIPAATTDYRVADPVFGKVLRPVGSSLETGEPLLNSYSYAAKTGVNQYSEGINFNVFGMVRFRGENLSRPEAINGYMPFCNLIGTAAPDYGNGSFTEFSCQLSPQPADLTTHPELPAGWTENETSRIETWEL